MRLHGRVRPPRAAVLLLAGVLLAGCSGGEEPSTSVTPDEGASSAPTEATGTTQAAVGAAAELDLPPGVALTPGDSELELGEEATVAWQPGHDVVGVLDITVRRVREVTWQAFKGWKLSAETRKSTPYFVDVTVANTGDHDLGGVPIPLYLRATNGTLVQVSEFTAAFKPCRSRPLPEEFGPGKSLETCLVYLTPPGEQAAAVVFRPTQEHLPISWSGDIVEPDENQKNRKDQKNRKKPENEQQPGGG